ncbi:ribosome-binding factor A [Geotalea daltonii FRC-32]|uniref:Ribosome-binding factor A n=1 Tax=Geotalea daltonii (strain DSM 22248 / JCM 15807 / FRC-32) TaxID=316067 RepID=RBFA_GEODF|nr:MULTISPECIES: ribosome-binding factor A [Geotalea]B9M1G1.1 RecName: Full=Ribosome-binding factor A [Geotalea daltonii FRC-32]ACM21043.1 ribosome-binding factor A [Geotalea daltonii FRC-32]
MFKRSEKVAEAVHELVSELLVKGLKDPRIGFVTITGVKVTDDMHLATIYFTVIGSDEEKKATEQGLNSARGFIRKEMGKSFRMRYVPDIVFKYDASVEYGSRIESILKEIGSPEHDDNDKENS